MKQIKQWLKNRLPAALILVIIWSIARESGVNFSISGIPGIVLTCCCIAALVVEFYKSGDRNEASFGWDLGLSVLATIICTAIITLLISRKGFSNLFLTDYILGFLIIFDAWFSPYNSFRFALRNIMYDGKPSGTGHDAIHESIQGHQGN
jgi:hypothetical protein